MGVAKVLVEKARELEPGQFRSFVRECLSQKKFNAEPDGDGPRFHVREAAEQAFGRDTWARGLREISARRSWVAEASTGATDASAFVTAIAAMSHASMEDGYKERTSELLSLPGKFETPDQPEGTKDIIHKYSATGAVQAVAPGTEYPRTGFATLKITAPEPTKFGLIAALTIEAVKSNDTRGFLKDNLDVGRAVGQHELEAFIRVLTGIKSSYTRNGTLYSTYLTSGSWVNSITDFNIDNGPAEFDRMDQLFDQMVHPVTGKSITVNPTGVIAVGKCYFRTKTTVNASQIRTQSATSGVNTTTVGPNPLEGFTDVKRDPNIRRMLVAEGGLSATQADTQLFYGDFKEAILKREVEPFTVEETANDTDIAFFADIVHAVKGRWWGSYFVHDPLSIISAYHS